MQHLLHAAKLTIERLRNENAILRAKVEVVDIFAGAIFGNRQGDPQPMAPDITWELENQIREMTPKPAPEKKGPDLESIRSGALIALKRDLLEAAEKHDESGNEAFKKGNAGVGEAFKSAAAGLREAAAMAEHRLHNLPEASAE